MMRALLLLPFLTLAPPAFAGEPTEAEKRTMAEAIYERASAALARQDYAVACPDLEEVVKLQPNGIGARITLADCYAASGRLASAHASYGQAASMATIAGQTERAESARTKAVALEPRLSKLTIKVAPEIASLPGLSVMRGGLAVAPAIFNVPIAVDGGRYTVAAVAEGREPFTATFEIDAAGASHEVELRLPAADNTVTPAARPRVARPEQATPTTMPPIRIAGIVIGSVGLTLAGIGIGLGVTGLDQSDEAAAAFEAAQNEQQAAAARDDHTSAGNLITAGWAMTGVGAAAAVAGIVLIAVAPDDAQPKAAAPSIRIRATAGGLSAIGTW